MDHVGRVVLMEKYNQRLEVEDLGDCVKIRTTDAFWPKFPGEDEEIVFVQKKNLPELLAKLQDI